MTAFFEDQAYNGPTTWPEDSTLRRHAALCRSSLMDEYYPSMAPDSPAEQYNQVIELTLNGFYLA